MEILYNFEKNGIKHSAVFHLMTMHNLLATNGHAGITNTKLT